MSTRPCYITTPIYYVNDRPHIGHCYTTVVADAAARFHRLSRGSPGSAGPGHVFLLTGTDEHADKVVTAAAERGLTPQEWADRNAAEFRAAFTAMGVAFDDFIRTTEPRHRERVEAYAAALLASGDVYKGEYTGWYDTGQEEYVPENVAREQGYVGAINRKPLVKRTEPCYFFRLSAYQDALMALIEPSPGLVRPDARRQEVLGRLRQGLHDVPVSRPVTDDPATRWGIRVPGDPDHRLYVWIDALFNYLSAVDTPERRGLWPPAAHILGKDILWFHAVIWPALLMALRRAPGFEWVALPGMVYAHAWWISEGQKMSKSLGNFIDLERLRAYADRYSLDALRWYLLTQGPLGGTDADFVHASFVECYNADLANGLGNCVSRVGAMIEKYFGGVVPDPKGAHRYQYDEGGVRAVLDWPAACARAVGGAQIRAGELDLAGALGHASQLIRDVDKYINLTAPFKLAKTVEGNDDARDALAAILYNCAETLRVASLLFSPAMPEKAAAVWRAWGCAPPGGVPLAEVAAFAGPHGLRPGRPIAKGEMLFARADPAAPGPGAASDASA